MPPTDQGPARATGRETDVRGVIEEFGRLLEIFSAQLAESLQEADRECSAVGESFHDLAAAKGRIETVECPEPQRAILRGECDRIGRSIGSAVVALQYHDRLTQRIGHIRVGLNHLQKLLRLQPERSDDEWLLLLQNVERTYHLEWHRLARATQPGGLDELATSPADDSIVELF